MIDDDVRRIDWLASAMGPSLNRENSIFLKENILSRRTALTKTQPTRPAPMPTTPMLLDLSKKTLSVRYPVVAKRILQVGITYTRYPKTCHNPEIGEQLARNRVPGLAWHVINPK